MASMFLKTAPFIIGFLLLAIIFVLSYVKAPPDTAYIISGLGKKSRVIIGHAGLKFPFLERLDRLSLKLIPLDIKTKDSVQTSDYINIYVDSAVNVKIKDTPEAIQIAAQNFLNKNTDEISAIVAEVLEGNVREIVCTMKLRELIGDRKVFVQKVSENVIPDLEKMGLELVSFNVQNFRDENHIIEDLGIDNISQIKKDASMAKIEADKEVAIAKANADKQANDARVNAETEIEKKNNELAIQKAELKKVSDSKKAEADAAYEIQKQEQEKTIRAAQVNAQIAEAEREAELKAREVEVTQQTLEAEIKKKAEADRYAVEQRAAAELTKRQRDAEAKKYEEEQDAIAKKAQADAEKYKMLQEAEGIRAKGEAEAAAIQARGEAEAAAMEKKAEAMKKYGQAAMMEMIIDALPAMAKAIAEPLSTIDKVTIIDSGNGENGVGSMGSYVPSVLAKTIESLKDTIGFDLTEVMKANTYDAKVTKNVNIQGIPEGTAIHTDTVKAFDDEGEVFDYDDIPATLEEAFEQSKQYEQSHQKK